MADFWFDPICPWTWITSRWLVEALAVRDAEVTWRVMSIAVLNEGNEVPPEYQKFFDDSWVLLRLLVAADQQHGQDATARLYTAIGEAAFVAGDQDVESVARSALAATQMSDLATAAGDESLDALIRSSHAAGMALVGDDVGSPILRAGENAFSGPIVSPAPTGEQAGRLWDAYVTLSNLPGFYEIKRTREGEADFG